MGKGESDGLPVTVTGDGAWIRNPSGSSGGGCQTLARASFTYTAVSEATFTQLDLSVPTIYQDPDGLFDGTNLITWPFDVNVVGNIEVQISKTECLSFLGWYQIADVTTTSELDDAVKLATAGDATPQNGEMSFVRHFSAGDTMYFEVYMDLGQPVHVQPVISFMYCRTDDDEGGCG